MVLTGKEILDRGIITDILDAGLQTQSVGIDLSVAKVETYMSSGIIDFDNSQRMKPRMAEVAMIDGGYDLRPGAYLVTFNETVDVPLDMMGIARPRSTMHRCGATVNTSVWDPGYKGKSQVMLTVFNQHGVRICKNARIAQLVFLPVGKEAEAYTGIYNSEGLNK